MAQRNDMQRNPNRRSKPARGGKAWLLIVCCTLILIAGGIWLGKDILGAAMTADYYGNLRGEALAAQHQGPSDIDFSSDETVDMRQAIALMDGESELTQEQKNLLEEEAVARREGFTADDMQFLESMADKRKDAKQANSIEDAGGSAMDFTSLLTQNEDLVAWLQIADTVVDYPVVQGEDNEFYVNHRFDRKYSRAGTLFMDYRNAQQFEDQNTIIYGHHMGNGTMFCSLKDYKKQAYFDEHPTLMLYTPEGDYRIELFAGYVVPIRDTALPCFYMNYEDEAAFMEYIAEAKRRSTFDSEVEVTPMDRIITLCTCTYEVYNARYVLQGKLVPMNASDI